MRRCQRYLENNKICLFQFLACWSFTEGGETGLTGVLTEWETGHTGVVLTEGETSRTGGAH